MIHRAPFRLPPVLLVLLLGACGGLAPSQGPGSAPLDRHEPPGIARYQTVVVEHRSAGCPPRDPSVDPAPPSDDPCAHARLEYPEFEGDDPLTRALRSWATDRILAPAMYEGDRAPSAESVARSFVEAHDASSARFPEAASFGWELERTVRVSRNAPPVVALVAREQSYTGGAHYNVWVRHQAFHPDTGETLTLDRILRPGAGPHVRSLLEAQFREDHGLAPGAPFTDAGLFEDLPLTDNLDWEPEGLTFHYNPYAVGPWSMGFIRVRVPWDELTPYLTDEVAEMLDHWRAAGRPDPGAPSLRPRVRPRGSAGS